jgi:hypothetical protein
VGARSAVVEVFARRGVGLVDEIGALAGAYVALPGSAVLDALVVDIVALAVGRAAEGYGTLIDSGAGCDAELTDSGIAVGVE